MVLRRGIKRGLTWNKQNKYKLDIFYTKNEQKQLQKKVLEFKECDKYETVWMMVVDPLCATQYCKTVGLFLIPPNSY